jgi:aminotransferase
MTGISAFGFENDRSFAAHLVEKVGVASVPGSSFYSDPARGAQQVRFAFCKRPETLEAAIANLATLSGKSAR